MEIYRKVNEIIELIDLYEQEEEQSELVQVPNETTMTFDHGFII